MSDPDSPNDREAVLRSIRRAVSAGGDGPETARAAPDRLLLGAGQRVDARPGAEAGQEPLVLRTRLSSQPDRSYEADAPSDRERTPEELSSGMATPDRDPSTGLKDRIARLEAAAAGPGRSVADRASPSDDASSRVPDAPVEDGSSDSPTVPPRAFADDAGDEDVVSRSSNDAPATAAASDDDAALRALIAEIVRQELQGVLGERITRNLRKLVRREIARSMGAGAKPDQIETN